ncbi:MAG: hypothetical protein QOD98_3265, partial [Nocardioidaceae bacterium]|nr:hypothetical protein [Nocardioidaceae bacterium]
VLARGGDDEPAAPPAAAQSFRTTPLSKYDATGVVVTRATFCDAIDDRQVSAALDGDPADSSSWANGDTIDLGNGVEDVAHEFGCRYTAADGTIAQAWVFAPPVDAEQAQRLVRSAAKGPGCEAADGPPFGSPTLALTCTKDGVARASYRGLFGDAWVVCEVVRPAGATWDVADRAGRWCVGVLEASA